MSSPTDKIERQITLKAPIARVWQALANAKEFGDWFRIALENEVFSPSARIVSHSTYPGHEHVVFDFLIERMEPERLLAIRWRPDAEEPAGDLSPDKTTLAIFQLEEVEGGTLLRFSESGYDNVPPERRAEVFRGNSEGWDIQMKNIAEHVAGT